LHTPAASAVALRAGHNVAPPISTLAPGAGLPSGNLTCTVIEPRRRRASSTEPDTPLRETLSKPGADALTVNGARPRRSSVTLPVASVSAPKGSGSAVVTSTVALASGACASSVTLTASRVAIPSSSVTSRSTPSTTS
jgi:hypothetical protein